MLLSMARTKKMLACALQSYHSEISSTDSHGSRTLTAIEICAGKRVTGMQYGRPYFLERNGTERNGTDACARHLTATSTFSLVT